MLGFITNTISNALVNYLWNNTSHTKQMGLTQRPQAFKVLLSTSDQDSYDSQGNIEFYEHYKSSAFKLTPPSGFSAVADFFSRSKKEAHGFRSTLHQVAYDLKSAMPDNIYLHSQFKKKFFWQLLTATPVSREEIKKFFADHKITVELLNKQQPKRTPLEIEPPTS